MSKKILVVEDDADLRRGLMMRLRAHKYEIVYAEDGVSAVSVARRERPDLVLLDIGLPGGDGFSVLRRLQNMASVAGVPVIIVTGRDPEATRQPAMELGATALFQKPVDNEQLMAAIAEALGETVPAG